MDIDIQWERAVKYARQFAFRHFETPSTRRVENLRNKIFEYIRRRDLKMDYFETSEFDSEIYCFTCLAYMPKFHFC